MTAPASARQVLLDLADRCEREEPSAELSADIAVAIGWRLKEPVSPPNWLHIKIAACGWPHGEKDWRYVPSYGTSLDAAVTLVPEGWRLYDVTEELDGTFWVTLDCAPQRGEGHAKTEAMARVAAALRARAEALP